METKRCKGCETDKSLTEFSTEFSKYGTWTRNDCKACMARKRRVRYAEANAQRVPKQKTNPTERQCKVCEKVKPLTDFARSHTRPDGSPYYRRYCKPCYQRKTYVPRKSPDQASTYAEDVTYDYRFARTFLGYSREQALAWLERGYHTLTYVQLAQWCTESRWVPDTERG